MLKLRYLSRLAVEFIDRFKGLIIIGVFGGILLFVLFNFLSPYIFGASTERVGVTGRYRAESLPKFILEMAGNGLTKIDAKGETTPDLAASWETPDKGKTWTFHLADGKFWQDGPPVTAKSIVYEFSDLTLERPNAKTLVFKLPYPFAPFPSVVSKPTFKKGLLGTGAWRVTRVSLNGNFVEEVTLENVKRERKVYKFYPTEDAAKLAYELGKVDSIVNILDPAPFTSWKNAAVTPKIDYNQIVTVFFNTQAKPFGDKSLRQALAYALKKNGKDSPRAISPISQNSWTYNPQVKAYDYDPGRAKELIAALPKEEKSGLQVKLVTSPVLLPAAENIARDWEAVGVKTDVQVSSGIPTDYQAYLAILDTPEDPDQYSFWHSTQNSTNISHYQSPRIDKLLEDGRTTVTPDERKRIYLDFQRFLVEDSPAIFLNYPVFYNIVRR